ncbi:hypothetical protein QBC39DRAFT_360071 [Podospora conica]|nr:hypothetical protein QBC39DRAFT_360071 [Schizothecium conicum]
MLFFALDHTICATLPPSLLALVLVSSSVSSRRVRDWNGVEGAGAGKRISHCPRRFLAALSEESTSTAWPETRAHRPNGIFH